MRQSDRVLDLEKYKVIDSDAVMKTVSSKHLLANLENVTVHCLGVHSAKKSFAYWQSLRVFWQRFFEESKATLKTYSIEGGSMSKAHVTKIADFKKVRQNMRKCVKSTVTFIRDSFEESGRMISDGCCNDTLSPLMPSQDLSMMEYPGLIDCYPCPEGFDAIPTPEPLPATDIWADEKDIQRHPQAMPVQDPDNSHSNEIHDIVVSDKEARETELSDLLEILKDSGQEVSDVEEMQSGIVRISVNDLMRQAREKVLVPVR